MSSPFYRRMTQTSPAPGHDVKNCSERSPFEKFGKNHASRSRAPRQGEIHSHATTNNIAQSAGAQNWIDYQKKNPHIGQQMHGLSNQGHRPNINVGTIGHVHVKTPKRSLPKPTMFPVQQRPPINMNIKKSGRMTSTEFMSDYNHAPPIFPPGPSHYASGRRIHIANSEQPNFLETDFDTLKATVEDSTSYSLATALDQSWYRQDVALKCSGQPSPCVGSLRDGQMDVFPMETPRLQEIVNQRSALFTGYGTTFENRAIHPMENQDSPSSLKSRAECSTQTVPSLPFNDSCGSLQPLTFSERLMNLLDLSGWLSSGVRVDGAGLPYFNDSVQWTVAGVVRTLLYNPIYPEFTSLQQFSWAVLLGIAMGVYTAGWKWLIETCVAFMWRDLPKKLLEWGIFTGLGGLFPLFHYMWIVPAIFGGVLSYIIAILPIPIPGQNEWINNLHSRGVQESDTFSIIFVLSTAGMASGLSLGPELPLILTSGMIGSWLGVLCKQSMLQARVLNLTAASAAIGGFFGFPMAGALFVLEIPHRTGLQYFEALSSSTIASIVAVLTNRLVRGTDVTGYYEYPFLNTSLPSEIFTSAIVYGVFGAALGLFYVKAVLTLKHFVHDVFRLHGEFHEGDVECSSTKLDSSFNGIDETIPLFGDHVFKMKRNRTSTIWQKLKRFCFFMIHDEPTRAGVAGVLVGAVVGITGIFFPHVMFWGEAQLQTLIDKGRTPLPVFGHDDESSSILLALGYCITDQGSSEESNAGFSLGCAASITAAKIFVTGLSLGTGITGGHFWGPLFAGCAASHFLTDVIEMVSRTFGFSSNLTAYPCVALLCMMGSTHVVTFRAHTAIILILTLTINAFDPEGNVGGHLKVAGDYSAVFPLLTVAVFVSLQLSRRAIFYEKQRSRGDIMALPEVLCEPGKEGKPLVMDFEGQSQDLEGCDYESDTELGGEEMVSLSDSVWLVEDEMTQRDIEASFLAKNTTWLRNKGTNALSSKRYHDSQVFVGRRSSMSSESSVGRASPLPPRPKDSKLKRISSSEDREAKVTEKRLDELLDASLDAQPFTDKIHRRSLSAPLTNEHICQQPKTCLSRPDSPQLIGNKKASFGHRRRSSGGGALVRVRSFGQVDQEQPSLIDQARLRAASFASADKPRQDVHDKSNSLPHVPAGRRHCHTSAENV